MSDKAITVVMPALNEEQNIVAAVKATDKAFRDLNINGDIIVINDGSTDKTEELVRGLMRDNKNINIINHDSPQGIGASFWDGAKNAEGDAVILIPGDDEVNPHDALRYFPLLQQVDIVIPFVCNKEVRARSRNIISSLFTLIINVTFGINLNYTNGTVIYRRSILANLAHYSGGFFYQAEALVKLIKRGYLFAEVPYYLQQRKFGTSTAISMSSFYKVAKSYLRLAGEIYFSAAYRKDSAKLSAGSMSAQRYRQFQEKQ
jgi:dolichol-phosphate mannosyltransferase